MPSRQVCSTGMGLAWRKGSLLFILGDTGVHSVCSIAGLCHNDCVDRSSQVPQLLSHVQCESFSDNFRNVNVRRNAIGERYLVFFI